MSDRVSEQTIAEWRGRADYWRGRVDRCDEFLFGLEVFDELAAERERSADLELSFKQAWEDCRMADNDLIEAQRWVAWFAAESAWLKERITQAIVVTDNEQLYKHDCRALIECDLINWSLAPHLYFKPEKWEKRIAALEVNFGADNVASKRRMLWKRDGNE